MPKRKNDKAGGSLKKRAKTKTERGPDTGLALAPLVMITDGQAVAEYGESATVISNDTRTTNEIASDSPFSETPNEAATNFQSPPTVLTEASEDTAQPTKPHSTVGIANNVGTGAQVLPTVLAEAVDVTAQPQKRPCDMKTIACTWPGCDKMFNRQARLDAHLRSHTGDRPFVCTFTGCNKTYTDNKFLISHLESAHLKLPKFVCDKCPKTFATKQRFDRHAEVHIAAERFRCRDYPPCNQTFRKRKTLDRHILKDHLGQKPFVCEVEGCNESYATLNALKSHTQREHGDEKFICGPCADKVIADPSLNDKIECGFTTKVLLELHIRHDHLNCVHCGDGVDFKGQYELERHIALHHTEETVKDRKLVQCDWEGCEKRFVKRGNMLQHRRTAHEGLRFECGKVDTSEMPELADYDWQIEGCGELFTSKVGVINHIKHIHRGFARPAYEPPQRPSQPSKEYSALDELSGVTDLERRPIQCDITGCRARFIRYADLHSHKATHHPDGENPFLYDEAASLDLEPFSHRRVGQFNNRDNGQQDGDIGPQSRTPGAQGYESGQDDQSLGLTGGVFCQPGQSLGPASAGHVVQQPREGQNYWAEGTGIADPAFSGRVWLQRGLSPSHYGLVSNQQAPTAENSGQALAPEELALVQLEYLDDAIDPSLLDAVDPSKLSNL